MILIGYNMNKVKITNENKNNFIYFLLGACFMYLSYLYKLEDNITLKLFSVYCYLSSLIFSTDRKWFPYYNQVSAGHMVVTLRW